MTEYFYAISRRDLSISQQAIQCAHAQHEYCRLNPDCLVNEHPTFVWLTVEDKRELLSVHLILVAHGVKVVEFTDPDYEGFNPSAIACLLSEEQRYLLSPLPLWNRPKKGPWNKIKSLLKLRVVVNHDLLTVFIIVAVFASFGIVEGSLIKTIAGIFVGLLLSVCGLSSMPGRRKPPSHGVLQSMGTDPQFLNYKENEEKDSLCNENAHKINVRLESIAVDQKSPGDWRAFLEWVDYDDKMIYTLRGYGDSPGKAADDAWRKFSEGVGERFAYTEISSRRDYQ